MQQERNIIVIGHKNPDTDSICSAIAYAHLKNMTTHSHHYVPMRAGEISQETMYVLDRFNMPETEFIGFAGKRARTWPADRAAFCLSSGPGFALENRVHWLCGQAGANLARRPAAFFLQ